MGVLVRSPGRLLIAALAVLASGIACPAAIRADQLVGDLEARIRPASGDAALAVALRPAGAPAFLAYRPSPAAPVVPTVRRPAPSLKPLQTLALVFFLAPNSWNISPDPLPTPTPTPVHITTITPPPSMPIPPPPPPPPPDNPPPVHVASTPEPASLVSALVGCGLVGLAAARRRRSR